MSRTNHRSMQVTVISAVDYDSAVSIVLAIWSDAVLLIEAMEVQTKAPYVFHITLRDGGGL